MARFMSGIRAAMRPMAKELIKSGLIVIDAISEFVAETGEQFKDLVAEAKSEMASEEENKEETHKEDTVRDQTGPKKVA